MTQPQGTTKPVFSKRATTFPSKMPKMIPTTAPIKLMRTDSPRNWNRMSRLVPPSAFTSPISLVRSFTATSMIFIRPIAAPINVMKAMPIVPFSRKPRFFSNVSAILSLLSMKKLSASFTSSFLTGRKYPSPLLRQHP